MRFSILDEAFGAAEAVVGGGKVVALLKGGFIPSFEGVVDEVIGVAAAGVEDEGGGRLQMLSRYLMYSSCCESALGEQETDAIVGAKETFFSCFDGVVFDEALEVG